MPDIELDHFGQGRDRLRRAVVEPVAGMNFKAEAVAERGAGTDQLPFGLGFRPTPFHQGIAP